MKFKYDISNIEKAFLIAHKYDYVPEIRQFILLNEGNWLYQLKDDYNGRLDIFRYTNCIKDLAEPFNSSIKNLFHYPVGQDLRDFIRVMNTEVLNIEKILDPKVNYDRYLEYMRYVLSYIYAKKIEAVLILDHVKEGGVPFFKMSGNHINLMGTIIDDVDTARESMIGYTEDSDMIETIARNIVLFYRLYIATVAKGVTFIEATKALFSYIASRCGVYYEEKIRDKVEEMFSDDYLPVVSNRPVQTRIHDYDKIHIDWCDANYDITSESTRSLTMFGATMNGRPLSRQGGLTIMNLDEDDIKQYVKTESVDFTIPENDLCYLRERYPDNGMILLMNTKSARHIFGVVVENEESPFLLFKVKESPEKIYGISCKTYKNHINRYVFETQSDGKYELIYGKVLS